MKPARKEWRRGKREAARAEKGWRGIEKMMVVGGR